MPTNKVKLFGEFLLIAAVIGGLSAALGVDPADKTATAREVVGAIAGGAIGAVYAAARMVAPVVIGVLTDALSQIKDQLFGAKP